MSAILFVNPAGIVKSREISVLVWEISFARQNRKNKRKYLQKYTYYIASYSEKEYILSVDDFLPVQSW